MVMLFLINPPMIHSQKKLNQTNMAIAGTINIASREKLHQELGLEYLHQRRWVRRLCLLYKILST